MTMEHIHILRSPLSQGTSPSCSLLEAHCPSKETKNN